MKTMKINIIIKFVCLLLVVNLLSSCLDGDQMNTPPGASKPFVEMTFNPSGGGTVNSGLQYFSGGAILYPLDHEADTAIIAATIQGATRYGKDVKFTLGVAEAAVLDYYSSDSIDYVLMPDDLYDFIDESGTIAKGGTYVEFRVKFYPNKFDPLVNYMLPVTSTNDANIPIASNFSKIYLHAIGNPIAGGYTREWIRYNTATQTGSPAFDKFADAIFAPVNTTTVNFDSGTGVKYIVSFTNKDKLGVLTDFKVSFDAKSVTDAGITISGGPTIIKADYVNGSYEFNFGYINSAGSPRNITDKFEKK